MSDIDRYTVEDCAGFAANAALLELEREVAFEASSAGHPEAKVLERALHLVRQGAERLLSQQ